MYEINGYEELKEDLLYILRNINKEELPKVMTKLGFREEQGSFEQLGWLVEKCRETDRQKAVKRVYERQLFFVMNNLSKFETECFDVFRYEDRIKDELDELAIKCLDRCESKNEGYDSFSNYINKKALDRLSQSTRSGIRELQKKVIMTFHSGKKGIHLSKAHCDETASRLEQSGIYCTGQLVRKLAELKMIADAYKDHKELEEDVYEIMNNRLPSYQELQEEKQELINHVILQNPIGSWIYLMESNAVEEKVFHLLGVYQAEKGCFGMGYLRGYLRGISISSISIVLKLLAWNRADLLFPKEFSIRDYCLYQVMKKLDEQLTESQQEYHSIRDTVAANPVGTLEMVEEYVRAHLDMIYEMIREIIGDSKL